MLACPLVWSRGPKNALRLNQKILTLGPDVRVFSPASADPENGASGIVIEAPYKLVLELDPIIERFIRIIDEAGELITTIELISPTNKRHPGLAKYRQKRSELLESGVHVVEVDLVRAGDWRALMRPELCPAPAVSTYRATIRVAGQRPGGYLFPIKLQETLPEIPIPLRSTEQPLQLPLQPLLDAVYADGRYDQTIDYARPLDPPLEAEEQDWAARLLRTIKR
jgi:hypothetical protein